MRFSKILTMIVTALSATGCNHSFHDIGAPPQLSKLGDSIQLDDIIVPPEPEVIEGPQRVSMEDNSIWNKKDAIYFKDTRAYEVGDLLTVKIEINDSAKLDNTSERDSSLKGSINGSSAINIPGIELGDLKGDAELQSGLKRQRGGSVDRNERIRLQVAAAVVEASSNGNLKIIGTQEVRVNHELRILTVEGVVRSKDILPDNTIPYEKIAEARISYGGHNTRVGQRHFNNLFTKFPHSNQGAI